MDAFIWLLEAVKGSRVFKRFFKLKVRRVISVDETVLKLNGEREFSRCLSGLAALINENI